MIQTEAKDPDFFFVQISDMHVNDEAGSEILSADLKEIEPLKPAFVVATGDLINNSHGPAAGMYRHYKKAIGSSTLPIHNVVGNHDVPIEDYQDFIGPPYYSFDYGGRHFVVLSCISDVPQQLDWLVKDLSAQPKGVEVLVFQHCPPDKELLELLSQYNTRAIFSGHWHASKVLTYKNILYVNTPALRYGGLSMSPRGFRTVSFQDGDLVLEDRLSGCNRLLTVASPTDGATVPAGKIEIKVNVHDVSSMVVKVEYRMKKEPWKEMASVGKWVWEGEWTGKTPGSYVIRVRANLDSGVKLEKQAGFVITEEEFPYPEPRSDWPMFQHDSARTGATEVGWYPLTGQDSGEFKT